MRLATIALVLVAATADAQTVNLRDYWPAPAAGRQVLAQDATGTAPGSMTILRRYVRRGTVRGNAVVRFDETLAGGWLDAWELYDDGTQVLEVGTWVGAVHFVYEVGREIQWGGLMTLGATSSRTVHVDVSASSGVSSGYWNWGTQAITFAGFSSSFTTDGGLVFADVVKLHVLQSWCATAACTYPGGQSITTNDYWLAPGVGIVQVDYLSASPARRDYARFAVETWEQP